MNLTISGASQITGNKAINGFGGGIYSTTPNVILSGTKVLIKGNKASLPSSAASWYQGYGIYASGEPKMVEGFGHSKQVIGNTRA